MAKGRVENLRPIRKGEVLNPEGRNQYSYRRDFEAAIQGLLTGETTPEELERVGVPEDVRDLIPEGATRGEVLAIVTVQLAMKGEARHLADALDRLWPKKVGVEATGADGEPITFSWQDPTPGITEQDLPPEVREEFRKAVQRKAIEAAG